MDQAGVIVAGWKDSFLKQFILFSIRISSFLLSISIFKLSEFLSKIILKLVLSVKGKTELKTDGHFSVDSPLHTSSSQMKECFKVTPRHIYGSYSSNHQFILTP